MLFGKRRAFCSDTLKITGWVLSLFQGCGDSASGLDWKATGLAKLGFKCHPALQGASGRVVEAFKGGVCCIRLSSVVSLKCDCT